MMVGLKDVTEEQDNRSLIKRTGVDEMADIEKVIKAMEICVYKKIILQ